ncbi:DUF4209 domain-containing protein [Luteolibacter sp. SL250]|uniref:DUF4209 domain-containing protein n=1 Tax=Luteolibacter sp. SL250 TaxID=2995170 RepID=UPI00226E16B3|nr:DUF4209 domain-containing protein [Luteolibacter sp. SL250]WAC20897.1 DUF4209 domain-containing protein [Luteolibacter sp. SL250]
MSEEYSFPTLEEIDSVGWESAVSSAELPICHKFSRIFFDQFRAHQDQKEIVPAKVYRFLGQISSMSLDAGSVDSPLGPAMVTTTGRTTDVGDFDDVALSTIQGLMGKATIPALRARLGDIVWIRKKDHGGAMVAAVAYLEEFKMLDALNKWVWAITNLERGFSLARILGSKNPLFQDYVDFILNRLTELQNSCDDAFCARLLSMLVEQRSGDAKVLAQIAESIGTRLEQAASDFLARQYFDIAVSCFEWAKEDENARRIKRLKGDSLVRLAEKCVSNGQGYFSATHHLAVGIECLRQGRDEADRIQRLHKMLLDWQSKSLDEMQTHTHETNVSEMIEIAQKNVSGKSLQGAVFAMAMGHNPIDTEALRKRVLNQIDEFPMASIFDVTMMDSDGRVVANKQSVFNASEEHKEAAIEAEMFHQAAQIDWSLRSQAYIDVSRRQIWIEHRPTHKDLEFLVLQNPFIAPGHEALFLKGIVCGFRGEFDIAAHLLVPQIEESIRYVLRRAGHVTSKLDAKLIQQQRLLGTLLGMPETVEIFGKNHVFELRGLLCEKFGYDLRNKLAHGFLTYNACWGADVINLWWLVLRFLCIPLRVQDGNPGEEGASKPDTDPEA